MSASAPRQPAAVVADVGWVNGLAAIRSLGRHGVRALAVDHRPWALGFRSRYAPPGPAPPPGRGRGGFGGGPPPPGGDPPRPRAPLRPPRRARERARAPAVR